MADFSDYAPELQPILVGFSDEVDRLIEQLAAGIITVDDWVEAMENLIALYHSSAYSAGTGGVALTDLAKDRLADKVVEQSEYLNNFAKTIRETLSRNIPPEEIPWAHWRARAQLYVPSVNDDYWAGQTEGLPLPAQPGDGNSSCKTRCLCEWKIITIDPSKGDYDAYWVMGKPKTEHCFPAGTMIEVEHGKKKIEDVQVGDLVKTRFGLRHVTKLFRHQTDNGLVETRTGESVVTSTPNHPFLTRRGWIRADKLRLDDDIMVFENGNYVFRRNIFFPYPNNRITTRKKISILGFVSSLLGDLSIGKWFKSGVSMPVFPISLNNEFSDSNVYEEFRFDKGRRFIFNFDVVKNISEFIFKFVGFVLLVALFTSKNLFVNFSKFYRVFASGIKHFLKRIGIVHRVVDRHSFRTNFVNNFSSSSISQRDFHCTGFVSDFLYSLIQKFSNGLSSFVGIVVNKIFGFKFCPFSVDWSWQFNWFRRRDAHNPNPIYGVVGISTNNATKNRNPVFNGSMTSINSNGFTKTIAALWASQTNNFCLWIAKPNPGGVDRSTLSGTKLLNPFALKFSFEGNSTFLTNKLLHGNTPQAIIPEKIVNTPVTVYNFEVEGVHEYIANGFVVHNCQTCLERARRWNPLRIRGLQLELPDVKEKRDQGIIGEVSRVFKHLAGQHDQDRHGWRYGKNARMSSPENQADYETWLKRSEARGVNEAQLNKARRMIKNKREDIAKALKKYQENNDSYGDIYNAALKVQNSIKIQRLDVINAREAVNYADSIIEDAERQLEKNLLENERLQIEKDLVGYQKVRAEYLTVYESAKNDLDKLTTEFAKLETHNNERRELTENLVSLHKDYELLDTSIVISEGMKESAGMRTKMMREVTRYDKKLDTVVKQMNDLKDKVSQLNDEIDPELNTNRNRELIRQREEVMRQMTVLHNQAEKIREERNQVAGKYLYQEKLGGMDIDFGDFGSEDNDTVYEWMEGVEIANKLAGSASMRLVNDPDLNTIPFGRAFADFPGDILSRAEKPGSINLVFAKLITGTACASDKETLIHEIGHHIEHCDPLIAKACQIFLKERTKKEKTAQRLSVITGKKHFTDDEVSKPDKFHDPYMGKIYPGNKSTEILSMGMQLFYSDPIAFAKKDPMTFDFVYAVLRMGGKV